MVLTGGSGEYSSRSAFAIRSFLVVPKSKLKCRKGLFEMIFKDWIFGRGGIFLLKVLHNSYFHATLESTCHGKLFLLMHLIHMTVLFKSGCFH